MHLGSEVPYYYTRYLATVKVQIAILVTFSAHQRYYTKYSNDFFKAILSLRVNAPNKIGTGLAPMRPGSESLGASIGGAAGSAAVMMGAGALIGNAIPIPGVGAAVGALAGAFVALFDYLCGGGKRLLTVAEARDILMVLRDPRINPAALGVVKQIYPTVNVAPTDDGLILVPSPTHVPMLA